MTKPVHKVGADSPPGFRRLMRAAMVEFSRHGRAGARVEKIATSAKINKQLIYHYFGSKDRLYLAALEWAYLRYCGDEPAIRRSIDGVDAETALRQLVRLLFGHSAELIQFRRLVQDANFHGGKGLDELAGVREAYKILLDAITEILRRGAEAGTFREGIDAREFYVSLTASCGLRISNASTLSYALGIDLLSPQGVEHSQEYAISLLLDGIKR